jgi:hypothetical protein
VIAAPVGPGPALFATDGGRLLCFDHLGHSAKTTGRDISGQPVARLTTKGLASLTRLLASAGMAAPTCEVCAYLGAGGAQ